VTTFLVYTHPSAGHTYPLVQGLLELQSRGHRVEVVTAPALVRPLTGAGISAVAVDDRILTIQSDDYKEATGTGRLRRGLGSMLARGDLEIADLDEHIARVHPDVVVVDPLTYGAQIAAERSGLPWAVVTASLLPMPGAGIPPYGLGLAPWSGPVGRLRDAVLWRLVENLYRRALMPGVNRMRTAAGLSSLHSPLDLNDRPDRLLVLSGQPLEYPRSDLPGHVRFVGAQHWDPHAETPDWLLEDGDPWVLVTCSTEYQADEELARVAVEALRDEPVRVVITLADAYDTANLPVADNVRVERFVPHRLVLERACAVICPSGMGLVQKAVSQGVPVVAVPFGRDQPEVARRVVEAGAGVALRASRLRPDRLRQAVHEARALAPRAADAGARLRASGGPRTLADALEDVQLHGRRTRRRPFVVDGQAAAPARPVVLRAPRSHGAAGRNFGGRTRTAADLDTADQPAPRRRCL
jgi:UDP:flavonoid glycosyltransferase YjiC (YdhE family)